MLGQISVVRDDGTAVRLSSVSQRRLVGFLASRANNVTPVGTIGLHLDLTDGAVRTGIARLRRRLGGHGSVLVTEGPGYVLATDRIDHVRFELVVDAALTESVSHSDARWSLERALSMWRGDAYAEFAHEEWAAPEAARLDGLRASATEALVDVLLGMGEHEAALEHAATLIDRHPFRDRPRAQQMRALASMGRVTESLRSFQEHRTLLLDEVGTLPSAALADLEQLIASGRLPFGDVWALSTGAPTGPTEIRNVVLPRNSGFGLDEISRQVASDLAARELVTLTGIGGVGKTRLALAVVARTAPDFDRAVFVDLRAASSADGVQAATARALGAESAAAPVIVHEVHRCRTLVVLDNCEHVLAPVAALVDEILAGPSPVRLLATSRQPLGVAGEHVRHVPVLSAEDATELFIARASKWRDTLGAIDDELNRQRITQICVRLDRIPLAVELAAACIAHMSLGEIAAQLDERLTFLPGDPIRAQQQRTLRTTMDWSYELLDPEVQSLLRALGVFAQEFDAAAAAAVWGHTRAQTLAGLGALVHASLVVVRPDDDTTRYELLETVRLHAEEKAREAGEIARLRSTHADHYAGTLEAIDTVELLRPASERRPDLANHDRLLEWVAGRGDHRRLGALAWRAAMAHRADCWTDPAGRYLGRDDVVAALTGEERSCYLAASFENANVLGQWADQLRFADLGLQTATGPIRVTLLRGAASACNVLAPERVADLVEEAIALADPADVALLLELRRTRAERLLLSGDLEAALIELRELWAEVVAAPIRHDRTRPLAGIDLLWVSIILGLDARVTALAGDLCDRPGGEVAGHCGNAVVAARAGSRAESARHLLLGAEAAAAARVPLVDNDVTVVAAVRALELGEAERACRLLASVRGGARSTGSYQLLRHARDLVRERLDHAIVARIRAETRSEDPPLVIAAELRRLRAEVYDGTPTGGRVDAPV